jgi:hypothetical protein
MGRKSRVWFPFSQTLFLDFFKPFPPFFCVLQYLAKQSYYVIPAVFVFQFLILMHFSASLFLFRPYFCIFLFQLCSILVMLHYLHGWKLFWHKWNNVVSSWYIVGILDHVCSSSKCFIRPVTWSLPTWWYSLSHADGGDRDTIPTDTSDYSWQLRYLIMHWHLYLLYTNWEIIRTQASLNVYNLNNLKINGKAAIFIISYYAVKTAVCTKDCCCKMTFCDMGRCCNTN